MTLRERWISLRQRVGFRGDVLLFLAFIDFIQAATLLTAEPGALTATNEWFGSIAPLSGWAAGWAGVGLICLYHAFRKDDHFAYVAAIGVKVVWGLGCFAAWILADVTILGGFIWLVFGAFVWRIASWPEPVRIVEDHDHDN